MIFRIRNTIFLLFFLTFLAHFAEDVTSLELKPNCGYPGKPYQAKLFPVDKSSYSDGEVVSYECRHYWAAPQTRKCVNGEWVGPEARCGDFIRDILMKDSQMFDVSNPVPEEKFHHTDMKLVNRTWKYPNSFTSNRFPDARLACHDDHEYEWYFNFTRPATKLYVKVNFNFLNYYLLPEEEQKAHVFVVEMEVSRHRTCVMQFQNKNEWRTNGSRYDTYFVCEANSHKDSVLDRENKPNYMKMRTKSNMNMTYELIALHFGTVYGTDEEPLCGEPSLKFGESARGNQENRDYMIGCKDENWGDVTTGPKRRFNYVQKCIGDMIWNGTLPMCRPKKYCPLSGALSHLSSNLTGYSDSGTNKKAPSDGRTNKSDANVVIDSIVNYFHAADSQQIFATPGSEVTYSCISDDYLLVGKDTRKCNDNNKWNGNEPICKYIKDSTEGGGRNVLMIVVVVMGFLLCLILVISGVLFHICTKKMKLKMAQAEAEKAAIAANSWQTGDLGMYDNIEMSGKTLDDDGIYEIYEHIEEPTGNEYTSYVDAHGYQPSYDSISPNGAMGLPKSAMPLSMSGTDDDYVRMLRSSARYEHILAGQPQYRNDSYKRRDAEPSYLEIHR